MMSKARAIISNKPRESTHPESFGSDRLRRMMYIHNCEIGALGHLNTEHNTNAKNILSPYFSTSGSLQKVAVA